MTATRLNNEDSGWITLPLGSNAQAYDSGEVPVYRKHGPVVNLCGAVKPKSNVSAGGEFQIGTMPEGCRPNRQVATICQGSDNSVWLCRVYPAGGVWAQRYRSGSSSAAMTTSTWLPFNVTYITA